MRLFQCVGWYPSMLTGAGERHDQSGRISPTALGAEESAPLLWCFALTNAGVRAHPKYPRPRSGLRGAARLTNAEVPG